MTTSSYNCGAFALAIIAIHSGDASAARGAGTYSGFCLALLINVRAKKYDLELKLSEKLANIWNFHLRKYELLKI